MKHITLFEKLRNSRASRIICAFLIINLLAEIVSPTAAMALTSGPSQPEFSSFEPVATTDMVNDFSGDFTYNIPVLNIPGPDGGGYSMSLAYHSGVSSEEEASWTGFGWTLNPGAINRNKRGFADEFNAVAVTNYNKTKPSWTQSSKFDFNMEYVSNDSDKKDKSGDSKGKSGSESGGKKPKLKLKFGQPKTVPSNEGDSPDGDDGDGFPISVSMSHTIRYNNYTGFTISNSFGVGAGGMANLNMNSSGGEKTLGFTVNPMAMLSAMSKQKTKDAKGEETKKWPGLDKSMKTMETFQKKPYSVIKLKFPTSYSLKSYNTPAINYSVAKNSGASWNFSGSIKVNTPAIPVGFQLGIAGNMNIMANEPVQNGLAFGYMNSEYANRNIIYKDRLYDYQVENETTFNKHDKNLGVPFNNADIFSATGNDVIGGFKMQHESVGSYYPNFSESDTKIRQLSIELGIGGTFQAGTDLGIGKQTTSVGGKWKNNDSNSYANKSFSGNMPRMRFIGDLGGELDYDKDYNKLHYATIDRTGISYDIDLTGYELTLDGAKDHSSSYPSYVTGTHAAVSTNTLITGVEITGKDGGKSSYLLPVYTKNEKQLTIGLENNTDGSYLVTHTLSTGNPLTHKTVVGQTVDQSYASTYLLTSKTTFNYVDVAGDGPTNDDFGGWTKLDYRQKWGDLSEYYRFRTPYNGLTYNNGRMLDDNDQTGSMSSGEKEVYYLKCIETKSHIAFFVTNKTTAANFTTNFPANTYTVLYNGGVPLSSVIENVSGSNMDRFDGVDAAAIDHGYDRAAERLNAKGTHDLEKLEKIVLFSKSDLSHPLTTTFFEYDYSLCPGIPNTNTGAQIFALGKGKLTLKRLWTESNGVNKSQIAPYQFHYQYFNHYPASISNQYAWAAAFNALPGNDANQNPQYRPEQLDAWGFYQENGDKRFEKMQHWLSQKNSDNNTTFDPAAWQLKRIQLPSGGEIHVHYEQKDYSSVQDKLPMAMVSLLPGSDTNDGYKSDESIFKINLEDINADASDAADEYSDLLRKYFIDQKNKLYFKALYNFNGEAVPVLNARDKRYEYITGYTTVNDISRSGNDILLHLGERRKLNGNGKNDKTLPRFVCYQELASNGGQNLGINAGDYKDDDFTGVAASGDINDLKAAARNRVLSNTINMFKDWVGGHVKNVPKKDACKTLNYELSYFKLPVYNAKKGGGIRVKRLITYDPGISGETGDASVFGSEYLYESENGASSGVATNEPASIREESAMIGYIERKKQKWMDKILNGRDTKQFEGFLGESILPPAEVVHSRIVIKNIRNGQSTSGYAINKYNTVRDYPMDVEFSEISKKNNTYKKLKVSLPLGMFNMNTNKAWVTQGYLFKLNDMHGKIASKAIYPGIYNPDIFTGSLPSLLTTKYNASNKFRPAGKLYFLHDYNNTEATYTSKTMYHYSTPGSKVPTLVYDLATNKLLRGILSPGTEEDITIFTSSVREKTNDFSIELDLNLTFTPPMLYISPGVSFNLTENGLYQHVTSKIVNQKSYLLATTNVTDGVVQTTNNRAFDRYTGDPVLTSTFDGYTAPTEEIHTQGDGNTTHNGLYYSLNIPASWMYPAMGQMSRNGSNTNQLSAMAGNVVTYGTNALLQNILTYSANWSPSANPLTNVVSASATQFSNNWFTSAMSNEYPGVSTATALAKANSFYYPERTFAYRDEVKDANAAGGKIYSGGVTQANFNFFNWTSTITVAPQWYSDSKITKYSPYGYPVEEEDVLGIKSSAKFGYENTLPVLVAHNAARDEVKFTDFEYGFGSNTHISTATAHSGYASYDLTTDQNYKFALLYPVNVQKGLSIKLWLKSILSTAVNSANYGLKNPNPKLKAMIGNKLFDFNMVAQTGEWCLYSADIRNFNGLASGNYDIQLSYNYMLPNEKVYVDDFRIQPLDASVNCSVYNPDNKLAVQFDDQHFGVFYEYNNKGQLVRKSIETERGKKTLQEQQYNTPLITR